jgi:hypothetical protein
MQNLEKLTELAKALTGAELDAALALVERMGEVIEGFGDTPVEWKPGLLKLVQGTSDRGKLPKGATIGSFVLGEEVLEQPYPVIPIRINTTRQMWNPDPEQAQMLCSSPDAKVGFQYGDCNVCPHGKFDKEANKSACNKTLQVLCLSRDLKHIFNVMFSKTNYMNGVDWQSTMKKAGVAPYKRVYNLSSTTSTKSKNVELIKAEPILTGSNRVEGALLEFVKEIFDISGEDRKQMLLRFYEYADKKKNQVSQLEAPADVVLIGSDSNVSEPAVVEMAVTDVASTGTVQKAQKYKM